MSLKQWPLYDPMLEHDACGVGLVAKIDGTRSRDIVEKALAGLVNLTHRGAVGADARTGDGAGILIQVPHALFIETLDAAGYAGLAAGDYGVAMLFLPRNDDDVLEVVKATITARGLDVLAVRDVPTNSTILGQAALDTLPQIAQVLISRPAGLSTGEYERKLMLTRRQIESALRGRGLTDDDFFAVSCSSRTLIYKGFCLPEDLARFYPDLADERVDSAIALFHQRFSTNTQPTWGLAQPFRFIAHNGEINTVQGNRVWMRARASQLSMQDGEETIALDPPVAMQGSDSLSLDTAIELLRHNGRSLPHALMMAIPEPWEKLPEMDADLRAFYDFHAGLMEQWDGPAALGFSDGVLAGAALDRNGLRPLRYAITEDGLFVLGSESGTVQLDPASVIERGRLGPGQMILVDTDAGVVLHNDDLKHAVAQNAPYARWLEEHRIPLEIGPAADEPLPVPIEADAKTRAAETKTPVEVVQMQQAFGYSAEDIRLIINPMAGEGKEPTWSMGDDAPLAVLSTTPRPVTAYFRQRFAQVTNPAIDSLRERRVMALDTYLGTRGNLLEKSGTQAHLVHLKSFVLNTNELDAIRACSDLAIAELDASFDLVTDTLKGRLTALVEQALAAVTGGASILLLSDVAVSLARAHVPMALAVGAIHHHLIDAGLRMQADIVCDAGDVWDVHQMAVLVGHGAAAVHPRLALDASARLSATRGLETVTPKELRENFIHMMEYGFLKVMAKMGISTASGYRGAQIFETIGLGEGVSSYCFRGTPARLGGIGFAELEEDIRTRHEAAFQTTANRLPDHGMVKFKKDGEAHAFQPGIVTALQDAAQNNDYAAYQKYLAMVNEEPLTTLRDLLDLRPLGDPVPIESVEPLQDIVARFVVTAMSLGSLSPEAHSTLAIAMNRLGGRSNSGEGGEDPEWYHAQGEDIPHNKVKQVASGRFGVTTKYLSMAEELEIKISQGAKPGEGGQLPGFKVSEFVARMRHSIPGLSLISPPPHHDIYSIEDLAQLIYDLRQVNPRAKIGVKLVAEAGVGTVAAGVAKAQADYVLVSGHSGGTGAAPLASIKHAGAPWELGVAETQQTLVRAGLRNRIKLRTDGGLKTPKDVLVAAMLGAEEFGFGTSVLVALGCDMARQCHLNTCPTGIATQRADLRAKFAGTPENVIGYFTQLVQGMRELMAHLGVTRLEEIIGRSDLLGEKTISGRARMLKVGQLLAEPAPAELRKKNVEIRRPNDSLSDKLWAEIEPQLAAGSDIDLSAPITTSDRTVGARIAGNLTDYRSRGPVPMSRIALSFRGNAGQSFGAFGVDGMELSLEGEANDYVGKGLNGGSIAVFPDRESKPEAHQVIAGNTILYGATGGTAFFAGSVGERFAVRNSGATAVVEGVGEHGCEYMTSGTVVVLGSTGRNFGAGMANGDVFVWDPEMTFSERINADSVEIHEMTDETVAVVRDLIQQHVEATGSLRGQQLLAEWDVVKNQFRHVVGKAALELKVEEESLAEGAAD
ncbi:MAG: glutamate synthase large subunit [Thermomicrobiales bacterium]|nr:glutamate synthase large subunit [Thermomicrobiales bacterium]